VQRWQKRTVRSKGLTPERNASLLLHCSTLICTRKAMAPSGSRFTMDQIGGIMRHASSNPAKSENRPRRAAHPASAASCLHGFSALGLQGMLGDRPKGTNSRQAVCPAGPREPTRWSVAPARHPPPHTPRPPRRGRASAQRATPCRARIDSASSPQLDAARSRNGSSLPWLRGLCSREGGLKSEDARHRTCCRRSDGRCTAASRARSRDQIAAPVA
jgi:hypothetical protein